MDGMNSEGWEYESRHGEEEEFLAKDGSIRHRLVYSINNLSVPGSVDYAWISQRTPP
jgi:hypothetical protein